MKKTLILVTILGIAVATSAQAAFPINPTYYPPKTTVVRPPRVSQLLPPIPTLSPVKPFVWEPWPTVAPTRWEWPEYTPAPQVRGATTKVITISTADRKAPDFIQNSQVPATVAKVYFGVFGHPINPELSTYWKGRARSDKATISKLRGAMEFHKSKGLAGPGWVLVTN